MKYAFIDYENIHSLNSLELQKYNRIFLFMGANQTHIHLTEKFNDEVNLTIITIKEIAKNNVDFHIVYYLGKLDETVDKDIEFHIISKDSGYDGICNFIQQKQNNRICTRITIEKNTDVTISSLPSNTEKGKINEIFQKYKNFMMVREKTHRPVKLKSLQNDILNKSGLKTGNKQNVIHIITQVINKLSQEKLLEITDGKVNYL